jgi:hypothetical protein
MNFIADPGDAAHGAIPGLNIVGRGDEACRWGHLMRLAPAHLCHAQAIVIETHYGSRWPRLPGKHSREFATSRHECSSPPRMKRRPGYFHVSINFDVV